MALNDRSRRVAELEGYAASSREEAIDAIRRKVTDALTGFEGKGLSISIRNGNVYVSMDDKLLFRSGSFEIDPNGARAVRDLAGVLAQNPGYQRNGRRPHRRCTLPAPTDSCKRQPRPECQTGHDRRAAAAGEQRISRRAASSPPAGASRCRSIRARRPKRGPKTAVPKSSSRPSSTS